MDFKLRWVQLIALFCLIGVCSSCLDDDKHEDWSETINLYVASQTADFYPQEFPSGIEPLEGIQVKENIENEWTVIHIDGIEGENKDEFLQEIYLEVEKGPWISKTYLLC